MSMNRLIGVALTIVGLATVVFVWLTVEVPPLFHDLDLGMAWGPLIQGIGLVLLVIGITLVRRGTLALDRPRR